MFGQSAKEKYFRVQPHSHRAIALELRGNNVATGTWSTEPGVLQLRVFSFHLVAFHSKPRFQNGKSLGTGRRKRDPGIQEKQVSKVKKSVPTHSTVGEEKNS